MVEWRRGEGGLARTELAGCLQHPGLSVRLLHMAMIADRIRDYLRGGQSLGVEGLSLFPPVDLAQVRKKANLLKQAAKDGSNNIPRPDANELSAVESSIKGILQGQCIRYTDEYRRKLEYYNEEVVKFNGVVGKINESVARGGIASPVLQSLEAKMKNPEISALDNKLSIGREEIRAHAKGVRNFRRKHGLESRPPSEPGDLGWTAALLSTMILVEFTITTTLFRESGDLLEVVVFVLVYSALNVLVPCLLFANGARQLQHISLWNKSMGGSVLGLYLIYCVGVNLTVAHYRGFVMEESQAARTSDIDIQRFLEAPMIALERLAESPFGLDMWSWAIFIIGSAISVGSFYKGWTYRDSYPGYGACWIRYNKKQQEFIATVNSARSEFEGHLNKAQKKIDELCDGLTLDFSRVNSFRSTDELKKDFHYALTRLNTDFSTLVNEYRNINKEHRSEEPPRYFSQQVHIPIPDLGGREYSKPQDPTKSIAGMRDWLNGMQDMHQELLDTKDTAERFLAREYPFGVITT